MKRIKVQSPSGQIGRRIKGKGVLPWGGDGRPVRLGEVVPDRHVGEGV